MSEYIERVTELIQRAAETQAGEMEAAAARIADSVAAGGVVHCFGTGHSHMFAEEIFYRAGGLACVNPILDNAFFLHFGAEKSTACERLPGLAKIVLDNEDVRPGEVIIITSNSGVNAVPVEMALEAKARGLFVVAITSLEYSQATTPRNPAAKRLCEVADLTLDNLGVRGDAIIRISGLEPMVGGSSTVVGMALLNAMMVRVSEILVSRGIEPPVFVSSNMPGAHERNVELMKKYRARVRKL